MQSAQFALIVFGLDNLVLDNYKRKLATYLEIGWDHDSADEYISDRANMLKIAEFTTPTVTFTASSRRNRYYPIYNRKDMLEKDRPFPDVLNAIKKLSSNFRTYILTQRTEDMKDETLRVMKSLGFPLNIMDVVFKGMHQKVQDFKRMALKEIKKTFPSGVGLVMHPDDARIVHREEYYPLGFASYYDIDAFDGKCEVVCENWEQVITALQNQ